MSAIDSLLKARFVADWLAIWPDARPVGLAVSGGPDSLGLLLLAKAALPTSFRVATVDHGLRPGSADEARYVAALCGQLGIQHDILTLALPPGPALQERARSARYSALGKWASSNGLEAIVTAHHADDQAETLLMRLSRGAGVRGLASMRARSVLPGSSEGQLLRPLLGWRKSELAAVVAAKGIEPVLDLSNRDLSFERVRMRGQLRSMRDLDPLAIATSARHLAQADEAIEWAAELCLFTVSTQDGSLYWDACRVPRVVALRVLERIIVRLGGTQPRGNALARWHDRLVAGEIATLGGVRGDGRKAQWRFVQAPRPRRLPDSPMGSR